jgi:hypothetical protein
LEKVPGSVLFPVDITGVGTVDKMHQFAEVPLGSLKEQMIVVGHQDITVKNASKFVPGFFKVGLEFLKI